MTINNSLNFPVTDWVAYTPTFTGFGTASSVSFFSRRVGDTLHIIGKFTSGTSTATEARITIGYNGTSANVNSSSTVITSIQIAGSASTSNVGAFRLAPLIESNVSYITIGLNSSGAAGLTKANGNALVASGDVISVNLSIPVTTWV